MLEIDVNSGEKVILNLVNPANLVILLLDYTIYRIHRIIF